VGMGLSERVTIQVSREVWEYLHSQKGPGDSFDDVLRRLLFGEKAVEVPEPSPGTETREEEGEKKGVKRSD